MTPREEVRVPRRTPEEMTPDECLMAAAEIIRDGIEEFDTARAREAARAGEERAA